MLQLVYVSKARPGLTSGDFEALLSEARERNRSEGLTGLLIYDGRRFLHAMEGPETHVERRFGRIALDSRHSAVEVVFLRTVIARAFGQWDLQLHRIDDGSNTSAFGFLDKLSEGLPDPAMADYMREFCGMRRLAA